jgi:hypothetical protein
MSDSKSGTGSGAGGAGGANGSNGGGFGRVFGWIATPGAGVFLLGATLAFGVIGASDRIGRALLTMKQDNVIRVKGVAEAEVQSDRASWQGAVRVTADTLPEAYAKLERAMTALRGFVAAKGITPAEVTVFSVDISSVAKRDDKGNTTNVIDFYSLRQSLGVVANAVDVVRDISNEVTSLIQQGIEIDSGSPSFTVSTIEEEKLALLERATANAHERAKTIARGSGGRPGRLVSASQGVFQIVAKGSTDSSDWGQYDTGTIGKTARCVVTLEYAID